MRVCLVEADTNVTICLTCFIKSYMHVVQSSASNALLFPMYHSRIMILIQYSWGSDNDLENIYLMEMTRF